MRYAIADIHGCCKTFKALIKKLDIKESDHLYLLGDYIDRGPDSKGVLDTIKELSCKCKVIALMGNHEDMWLSASIKTGYPTKCDAMWIENGGQATLKSFSGIDPTPYLSDIEKLPKFLELDDFYIVHAEFDFSLPDPFGKAGEYSMLWGRGKPYLGRKPVICGHTPLPIEQIKKGLKTNKINIDNGCCYLNCIGQGHLLAYGLDDGQLYRKQNIDDPYKPI
jgi:serine/threonine protein phosphatase 1